jgi:hypothetical protein
MILEHFSPIIIHEILCVEGSDAVDIMTISLCRLRSLRVKVLNGGIYPARCCSIGLYLPSPASLARYDVFIVTGFATGAVVEVMDSQRGDGGFRIGARIRVVVAEVPVCIYVWDRINVFVDL